MAYGQPLSDPPSSAGFPRPAGAPPADDTRGGEFIRVRDLLIRAEHVKLLLASGIDSLDRLFEHPTGRVTPSSPTPSWTERGQFALTTPRGEQPTFVVKRYRRPPDTEQRNLRWFCPLAVSTAGAEWHWMLELQDAGVACLRPVAFGEEVGDEGEIRSAVVAEAAPGAPLSEWCQAAPSDDCPLRHVGIHLARLVARLHSRGFVHRRLQLSEIYFDPTAPLERSVQFGDVQRVMQPRWRHLRWIVNDLAMLHQSAPADVVSASARLRWLNRYLCAAKLDIHPKWLSQRIAVKARRLARHDQQRSARRAARSPKP